VSQAQPAHPIHLRAPGSAFSEEERFGAGELLIFTMWVFLFFEPHWLVSSSVGLRGVITRIPLMLLLPTLILLLQRGRLETIHWPFALFLLLHLASWPLAMNRGLALGGFKKLLVFFIPFSATASRPPSR
jgi:hypothetical protein